MKIKPNPFLKNKRKEEKKARKFSNFQSKKFLLFFLTIITLSTALGIFVYFADPQTESATFGWIQEDWSGGNSEDTATHETDQTGWNEFSNKEEGVNVSNTGEATLQNTTHQHTSSTGTDFENWTLTNTEVSGDSIVLKQSDFTCGTSTIQDADGNSYETVQINDQCWMAENLNVGEMDSPSDDDTIQKYCYDNNESNCDTGGGLYDWNEMMQYTTTEGAQGICPDGWHIPTDDEWHVLEDYLTAEGSSCSANRDGSHDCNPAGSKLAGNVDGLSWDSSSTIASHSDFDSSGFNAPPSGFRYPDGNYSNYSSNTHFWSSSESGSNAWRRLLYDGNSTVNRNDGGKASGKSVRCLKDTNTTTNVHDIFDDGSAVATYQFDGDATDLGGSYDGTWSGTESYATGQFDQAADFQNSSSNYIDLNSYDFGTTFDYDNRFAISFWAVELPVSMEFTNSAGNTGFTIASGRSHTKLSKSDLSSGALYTLNFPSGYENGDFITIVKTGGNSLDFYKNGQFHESMTISNNGTGNHTQNLIGLDANGNSSTNKIDQIRIFNRALTAEEVDQLYNESN